MKKLAKALVEQFISTGDNIEINTSNGKILTLVPSSNTTYTAEVLTDDPSSMARIVVTKTPDFMYDVTINMSEVTYTVNNLLMSQVNNFLSKLPLPLPSDISFYEKLGANPGTRRYTKSK